MDNKKCNVSEMENKMCYHSKMDNTMSHDCEMDNRRLNAMRGVVRFIKAQITSV